MPVFRWALSLAAFIRGAREVRQPFSSHYDSFSLTASYNKGRALGLALLPRRPR